MCQNPSQWRLKLSGSLHLNLFIDLIHIINVYNKTTTRQKTIYISTCTRVECYLGMTHTREHFTTLHYIGLQLSDSPRLN